MTTWNINLTQEMDQFVEAKIQSGEYANASEVLCAGLRALERDEREQQTKLDALREAVIAGIASGIAEEGVVDRLRKRIRQRAELEGKR